MTIWIEKNTKTIHPEKLDSYEYLSIEEGSKFLRSFYNENPTSNNQYCVYGLEPKVVDGIMVPIAPVPEDYMNQEELKALSQARLKAK